MLTVEHTFCDACSAIEVQRKAGGDKMPEGMKLRFITPEGDSLDEIRSRSIWAEQTRAGRQFAREWMRKQRG